MPPSKITRKQEWKTQSVLPFLSVPATSLQPSPQQGQEFPQLKIFCLRQVQTLTAVDLETESPSHRHWNNMCNIIVYRCPWVSTLFSRSVVNFFPINFYHFSLNNWATPQRPICKLLSEMCCLSFHCCLSVDLASLFTAVVRFCHIRIVTVMVFFLSVCFFHRSLTSNLPNVNLPNVNLPKVPYLPVNIPLGIPQMPTFSAPSWMAAIYDAECVFSSH